jgi:hypothetical protein
VLWSSQLREDHEDRAVQSTFTPPHMQGIAGGWTCSSTSSTAATCRCDFVEDALTVTDENEPRLVGGPRVMDLVALMELGRIRIIRRPKAKHRPLSTSEWLFHYILRRHALTSRTIVNAGGKGDYVTDV